MKENFHKIRHMLSNMAYYTFEDNNQKQRAALMEAIAEVDRIIRLMDKAYMEALYETDHNY
jgi:hypothetical protein